jgi:tRNA (uracil-5-)-methyltransferase
LVLRISLMKYGERIGLTVESLDEKGRGIGRFGAREATVAGTVPGETVAARFIGRDKGRLRLDDPSVAAASPDRVDPPCPHAGTCGGCSIQHVAYGRQLSEKKRLLETIFAEAGHSFAVERIVPSPGTLHHRNRMDYAFGPKGQLGLKEAGHWDRYVDLKTCLLLSEEAVEVMRRVKTWAAETAHAPWDNRSHTGFLRYLVIREGKFTGERMATLVTAAGALEKEAELVEALKPLCTTVYHGINPLVTDLSIATELRLLHGETHLHERIGGVTYRIHPNAFFQTNSGAAAGLLEHVRSLASTGPRERLLDLYCGSGLFSLALSGTFGRVLGIELDPLGIETARLNADDNGIANAEFRAEPAEGLSWSEERPDVVIVDPPRSGLHPKVRRTLLEHRPPRIIYVSCGPKALATDLKELLAGYEAGPAVAFDLFPQTMHVETVIDLKLKI